MQNSSLSQGVRVLALLSRHPDGLTTAEIRKLSATHGRGTAGWNFSAIIDRLADAQVVVLLDRRWHVLPDGHESLSKQGLTQRSVTATAISGLRRFLETLADKTLYDFVAEAIGCLEQGFCRSAVILSWSGAIWVLQQQILEHHLTEFNLAGASRFDDFKKIKNAESFGRIQERDLIQLFEDIHLISKSLKGILIQRLDLRNTCGHPNTVKINESTAASHVEILIENIFIRFSKS